MDNSSKKPSKRLSKIERESLKELQKAFPSIKFFLSREELDKFIKERLTSK